MIVCWAVKGGSGTSVVAALLAAAMSQHQQTTLVDLGGDQPAILGVESEPRVGVRHWLNAGTGVLPEAMSRLTLPLTNNLLLLPRGTAAVPESRERNSSDQAARLSVALPDSVIDAGLCLQSDDLAAQLAERARSSLLIIRPCYLAIRRATKLPVSATGIIVVDEPGHALDSRDIEEVIGVPVLVTLPSESAVARSVDAGRLLSKRTKVSRSLERIAHELQLPSSVEVGSNVA